MLKNERVENTMVLCHSAINRRKTAFSSGLYRFAMARRIRMSIFTGKHMRKFWLLAALTLALFFGAAGFGFAALQSSDVVGIAESQSSAVGLAVPSSFAEGDVVGVQVEGEDPVGYDTIDAAFLAVRNRGEENEGKCVTLTLYADVAPLTSFETSFMSDSAATLQGGFNWNIVLDLNGYVMDFSGLKGSGTHYAFGIVDSTFTLKDSAPAKTHAGSYAAFSAGGILTGMKGANNGLVWIWESYKPTRSAAPVFNMEAGTIAGNASSVMVVNIGGGAQFNMSGGSITGNGVAKPEKQGEWFWDYAAAVSTARSATTTLSGTAVIDGNFYREASDSNFENGLYTSGTPCNYYSQDSDADAPSPFLIASDFTGSVSVVSRRLPEKGRPIQLIEWQTAAPVGGKIVIDSAHCAFDSLDGGLWAKKKVNFSASSAKSKFYIDEGMPQIEATVTDAQTGETVEGAIRWDGLPVAGEREFGYTFTPNDTDTYPSKITGKIQLECVDIDRFELRKSVDAYKAGTYFTEAVESLSVHKIYTDGTEVELDKSAYNLTLTSDYQQLRGGDNKLAFEWNGYTETFVLFATETPLEVWAYNNAILKFDTFAPFDTIEEAVKHANEKSNGYNGIKQKIVLHCDFGGDFEIRNGQSVSGERPNKLYDTITIAEGSNVTIDLNGHILDGNRINTDVNVKPFGQDQYVLLTYNSTKPLITVHGRLTVEDSAPETTHSEYPDRKGGLLTGLHCDACVRVDGADAVFTLRGGTIYDNGTVGNKANGWVKYTLRGETIIEYTRIYLPWNDPLSGGGVYVENEGHFYLTSDGAVVGNEAQRGGVYLKNGSVEMDGGIIAQNSASESYQRDWAWQGAGLFMESGYFTMTGGEIVDNGYAREDFGDHVMQGAGVYQYAGTAVISGGKIVNPYSDNLDYVWNSGTLKLSGDTQIGCIDFRKAMITISDEFTGSFKVSPWDGIPEHGTPVPIVYFTGKGVHSYAACTILPYNGEDCEVVGVDNSNVRNYAYFVCKRPKATVTAEIEEIVYPGDTLPELKITSNTPGEWAWEYADDVRVPVGGKTYKYTFTPYDTVNYRPATYWITVKPVDVTGISAQLASGSPTFYTSATAETLKPYIEAYAHFADGEPKKLTDFTLSFGELTAGSNHVFISANYAGADWATGLSVDFAAVEMTALSVECNQGDTKVFTSTGTSALKELLGEHLVITAAFNDGIAREVTDYTLSGNLSQAGERTITLSSGGLRADFTIIVTEVGLQSIRAEFDAGSSKIRTDFEDGKLLQYLKVYGTNNDGSAYLNGAAIPGGELKLTHAALAAGENTVTVSYRGQETTFHVFAVAISELTATLSQGDIAVYPTTGVDALLKLFGEALTVTATYSDGSTGVPEDYTLSGDLGSAGGSTATLAVICGGLTAEISVAVTAVAPVSVRVQFNQGSIKVFTTTDLETVKGLLGDSLQVTATYNDGSVGITKEFYLSGDISQSGSRLMTVHCGEATATFYLYVNRTVMTGLTVEFNQGDIGLYSNFSVSRIRGLIENAMTVTAYYSDNTQKVITDYEFSGSATAGDAVPFTISYGGMSKTVNLKIVQYALESITIQFDQNGHAVYTSTTVKDFMQNAYKWFDMTMTSTYNDGSVYNEHGFFSNAITLSGDFKTPGSRQFTISYYGVTSNEFTVDVTAVALGKVTAVFDSKWNIINTNNALEDLRQYLTVTAAYNDGALFNGGYPIFGYEISGDLSQAGQATVIVTVTDSVTGSSCSGSFTVEVAEAVPAELIVRFSSSGPVFISDFVGVLKERIEVTAKYADGSDYDYGNPISNYTLTFKSGDSFVEGKNTIVASWNGLSVEFSVEAVEAALNPDSVEITVYNPYNDIIYTRWGLDKLLPYIKVSAEYADGREYPGGVGLGGIALSYTGGAAALREGENVIAASFGGITRELTVYAVIPAATVRVDGGEEVYTAMLDETCFNPANSNGKTVRITLQRDIDKNDGLKNIAFEFSQTEAPAQIVLDLNGYVVDLSGAALNNKPWLKIYRSGMSLVITDSRAGTVHTERRQSDASFPSGGVITGMELESDGYTGVIVCGSSVGNGADLRLDGGTLYKNKGGYSTYGNATILSGIIRMDKGVFTMNGGAIIGNTQAGKFDFGNGTTNRYGAAGVYISSGTFIMNGGVIEGNTDEGNNGLAAQVYVRSGEFIMNGGRIEVGTYVDQYNNVKSATTFAVYVNYRGDSASVFTMNGGELCADVRNQAAVYVNGDSKASTVFNLRGGTISATGTSYFEGIEISLYAKMNLSGDPEIDAVIYLNGDSNANRYAEITIDGAFGGTIKGVHGMTYDYTNPPRKLIKIASNGTILPHASIGAKPNDPRYTLAYGEDGDLWQYYALLDPVVNPVLSGTYYIDGELPEISLSTGDTAGTIRWVTYVDEEPNIHHWKFIPDQAYVGGYKDDLYKTIEGTIVLEPVAISGIEVRYSGSGTLFEGTVFSDLNYKFNVYVLYENGDSRMLVKSERDAELFVNGERVTVLKAGENIVRATYTNAKNGNIFTAEMPIAVEEIVFSELTADFKGNTMLVGTELDNLRDYFTVKGKNNDGTSVSDNGFGTIINYALCLASGGAQLAEGENIVIVSYEGLSVEVIVNAVDPAVGVKVGESGTEQYFGTLAEGWDYAQKAKTATIILYRDIVTSEWLVVKSGTTLTLDLNGHILDRNLFDRAESVTNGCVICVQGESGTTVGAKLILKDSAPDAGHTGKYAGYPDGGIITGGNMKEAGYATVDSGVAGGGISVLNMGSLEMYGGTVYRNRTNGSGGGIWLGGISARVSSIKGGAVLENEAGKDGGGIWMQMNQPISNVTVANNAANKRGGGIYSNSWMDLNSCYIYDNTAKGVGSASGSGGGIYAIDGSELNSCYIYGNTANGNGGGVFTNKDLIKANNTKIYGNSGIVGGGIYCGILSGAQSEAASLTLTDCEIYGNTATENVGGMYIRKGCFIYGSTRIENNCVGGQWSEERGYYIGGEKSNVGMIWTGSKRVTIKGTFTGSISISSIGGVETSDPDLPEPGEPIENFIYIEGEFADGAVIELDLAGYKLVKTANGYDLAADGQAPQVQPVAAGKLYIDGKLPALTAADGAVAGTFEWLDGKVFAGAHAYRWRFTPIDLEAYKVTEGEIVLTAISIIGLDISQSGDIIYTSADIDAVKAGLTARIAYADGTFGRALDASEWTLHFMQGQTALEEGGNSLIARTDGVPDTDVVIMAAAVAPKEITATIDLTAKNENGEIVPVTVYDSWTLSDLAKYITVTGINNDGSLLNGGNAIKGFALRGKLTAGACEITVEYGGATATVNVQVEAAALTDITILFDAGEKVFSTSDTAEDLRWYLAVMAVYGDTEKKVLDYELPNQKLVAGDNEIEVTYGGIRKTFTVHAEPDELSELKVVSNPVKTSYNAFENFDPAGLKISAVFSVSGEREITDFAVSGSDLRFGTTFVTVSYTFEGVTKTVDIAITVAKIDYDMSGITFAGGSAEYDGAAHGLFIGGTLPTGRDGIALSVRYEGAATDAGIYTVRAVFVTDSDNYNVPEAMTATLTIDPKTVKIVWAADDFTYDGTDQIAGIKAHYVDVFGKTIPLAVTGDAFLEWRESGYTFAAAFAAEDGNYVLPTTVTKNYTMKKRALTVKAKDSVITYGQRPENNGAEYIGFADGEGLADLDGSLSFSYTYAQFGNAGTYAVTPSGLTSDNYTISFADGVLTVEQAPVTVTIDSKRSAQGDEILELTVSISGTVYNGDKLNYTLSMTADKTVVGTTDITGTDTDFNYAITFVKGTYEVYSIDAYLAFQDTYGALIAQAADDLVWEDVADIEAMYSAYEALNSDNSNRLTKEERAAVVALKDKADAISAAKSAAEAALDKLEGVTGVALREGLGLDAVKADIEAAIAAAETYVGITTGTSTEDLDSYGNIASAQESIENYEAYLAFEEAFGDCYTKEAGALGYPDAADVDAMYDEYEKLSDDMKAVLNDAEKDNIAALKEKAAALEEKKSAADDALGALAAAIKSGADKETLETLAEGAKTATDTYVEENGKTSELSDFGAIADAENKISVYEQGEISDKIENDLGALKDWTDEVIGGFTTDNIADLADAIDKIKDTVQIIDASSESTRDELAETRAELEALQGKLAAKLKLETAKADAISDLNAEREKILSSATYTSAAKKEIARRYDDAIQKITSATQLNDVDANKESGVLAMNAVEALHVGWLVADLVLAALLLAEIGYLVWRKRRSKKNYSATYSVAPLGLLAAASGAGLTTGIVFFVLLLVSVLFLGVWIADRIIREHGKKSPFAPVTDRGDRIVARLAHKARSCTADDTAELSRPDAIAVAESDEKQLEAQVELGDTEEDIETHIVQLSDKKVSVRYNFSFQAKLIQAPAEVQRRYGLLTELLGQYSLLNSVQSWKQLCYYVRRNPVALFVFRGRTLCIALPLEPQKYAETKYRGLDVSAKKGFAKTPLMLKLTSDKKTKYAAELLQELLSGYAKNEEPPAASDFSLPYQSTEELVSEGLVRVLSSREIPTDAEA